MLRRAGGLAAVICVLYVLLLAGPVHHHTVGVFSDFYRFYAPDADLIRAGSFPRNTFNPPGYPLLLAVVAPLSGDHFVTGKWLSVVAAALAGWLAFTLHRRLFGPGVGLLVLLIVLSAPVFATYAVTAMTDVPFLCLALAAMVAITAPTTPIRRSVIVSGVLSGVAYLVRYNGAFLLVPGLLAAVMGGRTRAERTVLAAVYLGSFALVAAPWWWLNYVQHGSPVYSTNYRDVARALTPSKTGEKFASLTDVMARDPLGVAGSYVRRVGRTFGRTLGAGLAVVPVGPLALLGIALSLARERRRPVLLVLAAALSSLLVMSLTHWEPRYHLFLLACYAGFAALGALTVARTVGSWLGSPLAARLAAAALALLVLVPSSARAARAVRTTVARQPVELLPAARYLRNVAPPGATVMAMRAQIAYLSGRPWRELPDAPSLDGLRTALGPTPPAYLVYDRWTRFRPGLGALGQPAQSPPWLRPLYVDPAGRVVVYAVQIERR